MSQLDARLGRGCSSVGSLNRLPAMPAPSEWEGTFNRRQNDLSSPARSAALPAIGKAKIRRVVMHIALITAVAAAPCTARMTRKELQASLEAAFRVSLRLVEVPDRKH
jgi:hypothetical protein